ncbi:patatin-like phospholipase family protein [Hwanghaeella sp.]|uniref:patatin-like phospholipase family protein n=1 Tax=Hwanghaeella sp. TaxID=2605943 RepID=UPI003CCC3B6C
MPKRNGKTFEKSVNLALQGGGAHGAFTWGVLDRLLEDGRIYIEAISGTSAGAMNAVAVADGLMRDGEDGARQVLHDFWQAVSDVGRMSPIQRNVIDVFMGNWSLDNNPSYMFFDLLNRVTSPYDLNPMNFNPLRGILESTIDFDRVAVCDKMQVFLSATNVETGRVRVFNRAEINADVVLASACLPFMFHAVEIDGTPYWDGGYMGNPVLFPFYRTSDSDDIVIVQINPVVRKGTPRSAREILDRVNEITFNSSLLKELRAIDFVHRLLEDEALDSQAYRNPLVHIIECHENLKNLGASSKLNAEWSFLRHLFEIGRGAADEWIDRNYSRLGVASTVDIRAMFQGIGADHQG